MRNIRSRVIDSRANGALVGFHIGHFSGRFVEQVSSGSAAAGNCRGASLAGRGLGPFLVAY